MRDLYVISHDSTQRIPGFCGITSSFVMHYHEGPPRRPVFPPTMTIPEVVATIVQFIGDSFPGNPFRSIGTLFIGAHGQPGRFRLGTGVDASNAAEFGRLSPFFAFQDTPPPVDGITPIWGQGIELHGCNVAQGALGEGLLSAMARATHQIVKGGHVLQYRDECWNYEGGQVTSAFFDGSFLLHRPRR
jgi:hypothetical protein